MEGSLILSALLFILPFMAFAQLPDTGQTKCYNNDSEITCPPSGQPFHGQDAQYVTNPQSYTQLDASGNDMPFSADYSTTPWTMVRDNVTGLIWEVKDSKDDVQDYSNPHDADNTYTWYDSNPATNGGDPGTPGDGTDTEDFINALNESNFGGNSDWRLPTINELSFIRNMNPHIEPDSYYWAINENYFPNTMAPIYYGHYWSSTPRHYPTDYAWDVEFTLGRTDVNLKSHNSNY